jgi:hypothetical protein
MPVGRSVNRLSHYHICAEGVHVGSCAMPHGVSTVMSAFTESFGR